MPETKIQCRHCGTCDNAKWFWSGMARTHRQYYCQRKLQHERQKSDGNERNAYVRYMDTACEDYTNFKNL